jgi:hypothetical protein
LLKSRRFRFRNARGAGLAVVTLQAYALAAGCSGQSTRAPGDGPAAGMTQTDGGKHAGPSTGGASRGGAGQGGSAGFPSGNDNGSGTASGGKGLGGSASGGNSSLGGQTTDGGESVGGAAGTADGGAPSERTVGVTGGRKICINNMCGFACIYQGVETFPGDPFWIDCNSCLCNWDGSFDCETKDCAHDCAYFANEYEGAYGEAQYCLMDPGKPDPCTRTQSASLYCDCPTPVSTDPEFIFYSQGWVKRWNDGGCTKPDDVVCPPCHAIVGAHCDMEQGICVSQ